MHQGKNGLAFVEVLLARKIYFGEVSDSRLEGGE
jgi:hypothetical protein